MNGFLMGSTLATAISAGVMGGAFFAFSVFVMPALGDLPSSQGIAAMQSINRAAVTPPFMIALFGTALACAVLVVVSVRMWGEPFAGRLLAGGVAYLAGVIAPTAVYHVPRNDALAAISPSDPGADAHWARYLSSWTDGNHLRTVAAVVAALALADALRVGAEH